MKIFTRLIIVPISLITLLIVGTLIVARHNPSANYWLAFVGNPDETNEIYRVRPDGTHLERLTYNTVEEFNPVWSPQGAWIVYLSVYYPGYNNLTMMRHDGSLSHHITGRAEPISDPNWLDNSDWITYIDIQRNNRQVFKMDVETGASVLLTGNHPPQTLDAVPIASPDGEWIALRSTEGANTRLMSARRDGSQVTLLAENIDGKPSWSPDNEWLAFGSNWQIFLVRRDGSQTIPLTAADNVAASPAWSPDGQWIAFSSFGVRRWDIYKVRPDGSDLQVMTDLPFAETDPNWSPIIGLDWHAWMMVLVVGGVLMLFALQLPSGRSYLSRVSQYRRTVISGIFEYSMRWHSRQRRYSALARPGSDEFEALTNSKNILSTRL